MSKPKHGQVEPHLLNKTLTAKSCGISVQAFDKWGVQPIKRVGRSTYFDMRSVLDNRLEHLNGKINQIQPEEVEEGSLDFERFRLTRAQADSQELKNEIARQEVVPVEFATFALAKIAAQASGILDSLPLNLIRKHPELTTVQQENIQRELAKAMNALSGLAESLPELLDDYIAQADH